MDEIRILDCTLRDGGYCNDWQFGKENIKKIVRALQRSGVDFIECGYLTGRAGADDNSTCYNDIRDAEDIIAAEGIGRKCFLMINFGEYDVNRLPQYNGGIIGGIRLAFHKKDMDEALDQADVIREKGYSLFLQPMIAMNYTDEEFSTLTRRSVGLLPDAFYVVDSFGTMRKKQLLRLLYIADNNLDDGTVIGFHAHNNLQLAYANAQCVAEQPIKRKLIVDTCIYGMGRGAGNLNTELFADFLNEIYRKQYDIRPIVEVVDEVIDKIYKENPWGYSLVNYISAIHGIHPHYARFLAERNTLTVDDIDRIFRNFVHDKKYSFDEDYIEKLYTIYLGAKNERDKGTDDLNKIFRDKRVIVIGPGRSAFEKAKDYSGLFNENDTISVSVNFDFPIHHTDYIFVSNQRRFKELDESVFGRCIITSNIISDKTHAVLNYNDYVNDIPYVEDNAGLMLLKFLSGCNVKEVLMAGFDGYCASEEQNYAIHDMVVYRSVQLLNNMNKGVTRFWREYISGGHKLTFLTEPKFIKIKDEAPGT